MENPLSHYPLALRVRRAAAQLVRNFDVENLRKFIVEGKIAVHEQPDEERYTGNQDTCTALEHHKLYICKNKGSRNRSFSRADTLDPRGYPLLHIAVRLEHTVIVELLLSLGANPNITNRVSKRARRQRDSALHLCVRSRVSDLRIPRLLISAGANVNQKDGGGFTPLYRALWRHCTHSVNLPLAELLANAPGLDLGYTMTKREAYLLSEEHTIERTEAQLCEDPAFYARERGVHWYYDGWTRTDDEGDEYGGVHYGQPPVTDYLTLAMNCADSGKDDEYIFLNKDDGSVCGKYLNYFASVGEVVSASPAYRAVAVILAAGANPELAAGPNAETALFGATRCKDKKVLELLLRDRSLRPLFSAQERGEEREEEVSARTAESSSLCAPNSLAPMSVGARRFDGSTAARVCVMDSSTHDDALLVLLGEGADVNTILFATPPPPLTSPEGDGIAVDCSARGIDPPRDHRPASARLTQEERNMLGLLRYAKKGFLKTLVDHGCDFDLLRRFSRDFAKICDLVLSSESRNILAEEGYIYIVT